MKIANASQFGMPSQPTFIYSPACLILSFRPGSTQSTSMCFIVHFIHLIFLT